MGIFGKKDKNGNRSCNLKMVDGVKGIPKGWAVEVSLDESDDCLVIRPRIGKDIPTAKLKYCQIIRANVVTEKEITEANKNSIGRAIVGGIALGPLGAIIGGVSGIGKKENKETKYYIVLNYNSSESELKVISFEIVGASLHWSSFIDELRTKITTEDIEEKLEEVYL